MSRKLYKLYPSTNATKKYDIYVTSPETGNVKKVSFGAKGYEDYTIHRDIERRRRYRLRHQNDRLTDPTWAGFWSWYVLWGPYTSINKNLQYTLQEILQIRK